MSSSVLLLVPTTNARSRADISYKTIILVRAMIFPSLTFALNAHTSVNFAYSLDLGQNAQDGVVNPQTREYHRELFSLGALLKF